MFTNQTRGAAGLGAIVAVIIILAAWMATAGVMWKSYRDGGDVAALNAKCELVCAPVALAGHNG